MVRSAAREGSEHGPYRKSWLKTIKVHRARVMEKMRAASVAELVRLADAVGVIVPSASERLRPAPR